MEPHVDGRGDSENYRAPAAFAAIMELDSIKSWRPCSNEGRASDPPQV